MLTFNSATVLFVAFIACLTDAEALQENAAKKLLIQDEVGVRLHSVYRSALLNKNWTTPYITISDVGNISLQCLTALYNIKNNPVELFKYVDAAGKPRSGVLRGNLDWLGSYSECESLSDAKYCVSQITLVYKALNINIPKILWGSCFPKSCSDLDVKFAVKKIIIPLVEKETSIQIEYPGSVCPSGPTYDSGVIGTLVFFGILVLFCLIGTIIEFVMEEKEELKAARTLSHTHNRLPPSESLQPPGHAGDDKQHHSVENIHVNTDDHAFLIPNPSIPTQSRRSRFWNSLRSVVTEILAFLRDFFLCFSLVRNSTKIFNMDVSAVAITSLNGIRVISISWVVLGHLFILFELGLTDNKVGLIDDSQLFSIMPVINGFYSVDTFFFLSGLLVAYTCFRKLEKSGGIRKFNWLLFYFHRFWRLTPTYMVVILISVHLKRFLASGPIWYTQYEDKLCKEYWWTNLLYINNFHPNSLGDECVGVSWYLANDMQFFIITPLLLIPMYTFKWRGVIGPASLIAASTAVTAFIIGWWDLDPLSKFGRQPTPEQAKKAGEFSDYVYIKPWCRIQPYLVGFIMGYYFYRKSQQYYNPKRRSIVFWLTTIVGWLVAAGLGMGLVYGPHKYVLNDAAEWPLFVRILYGALQRLLWGLVLAWVIYACHFGGGGLVKKFLSAKFWIPLSRLTFSVYLLHIFVLIVMFVGAQGTIHYDDFNITYYFIAVLGLSYAAAFILAILVEYPSENLEYLVLKMIRGGRK